MAGNELMLWWPVDMSARSLHGHWRPRITSTFAEHETRRSTAPGLDIGMDVGTEVRAAAAGMAFLEENEIAGKAVRIRHLVGGQLFETLYCHLSEFVARQGQEVAAGDVVGHSGSTGHSTGPHLHFAVCLVKLEGRQRAPRRTWVDPEGILPAL